MKIMKTTNIKKIASIGALALALALTAGNANANGEKVKNASKIPVEVRYVGSIDQQPVLEVAFDNEAGESTNITLRDMDGNVLYTGSFSDKKITKRFQFDNHGLEDIRIKLTVSAGKKSQTEVYEINRNSQVIEEVKVARL